MSLSLIWAMTEERVIGVDNRLPWKLSEDLKRFKQITLGHPILMGRKTFESIGRVLPNRENLILTRQSDYEVPGGRVYQEMDKALDYVAQKNGFVIGGEHLFRAALPLAETLYITLIHERIPGDTYFPLIKWERDFTVVEKTGPHVAAVNALPYSFLTAKRNV